MKYLDIPSLALLSQSLTFESAECKVHARLEAYSCKNVRNERRLWKGLEVEWKEEIEGVEELSISPELKTQSLLSPFGPLSSKDSRHTHFLLVSTLNLAFPDYDFSRVKPERFEREIGGARGVLGALSGVVWGGAKVDGDGSSPRSYGSYPSAVNAFSPPTVSRSLPSTTAGGSLAAATSAASPNTGTHPMLHKILNDVIGLDDCVVYSYVPEPEADPHEDGVDDDDDADELAGMDEMDADGDVSDDDGMMMRMDVDEERSEVDLSGGMDDGGSSAGLAFGAQTRNTRGNGAASDGPRTPRGYESESRGSSGLLWSVYYFFYNKRQKRILFLSVWARSRASGGSPFLRATRPLHTQPIHVVRPTNAHASSSAHAAHTQSMPLSKSQQLDGLPSLDQMARTIVLHGERGEPEEEIEILPPGVSGTQAFPIRINSPTPSASSAGKGKGMTAAAATLAAASASGSIAGSPPPREASAGPHPPTRRGGRGITKHRRDRSESTSTTASGLGAERGERLRELANEVGAGAGSGTRGRAGGSKRVKV